ncbi:Bgt-2598 [Blumeria graminis f. sp. tritici]|uniref:Elongation factor 1-beta n=1 Tax=Blumeria graminis f. sp. tritici TaxID=62690 RepID=A0A9X9ML49_BLUGR|nr:Bgt-2598 [Blumeria graminis f. sp. tritici]
MGFEDLNNENGLQLLNDWLKTRSYIDGYVASQADVAVIKSLSLSPQASVYPHAARWYKHINSYKEKFSSLPGDSSKDHTQYGPEKEAEEAEPSKAVTEEEDDIDLFGSDDEEEDKEAEKLRNQRLEEYRKKKEGKTKPAAKSVVTLEVKPWDDETNMKELEEAVRAIEKDGLLWGSSKLVPVGFGIMKLQITLVIEDEKIGLTELQEEIQTFDDYVQSTDIVSSIHTKQV